MYKEKGGDRASTYISPCMTHEQDNSSSQNLKTFYLHNFINILIPELYSVYIVLPIIFDSKFCVYMILISVSTWF